MILEAIEEVLVANGGSEAFRRFVNQLIGTFKYKSIGSSDFERSVAKFFAPFRKESGFDMEKFVSSWLHEPGMPIIQAIHTSKNTIVVVQVSLYRDLDV